MTYTPQKRFAIFMLIATSALGLEACRRAASSLVDGNGSLLGPSGGTNTGTGQGPGGCQVATCEDINATCGTQPDGCGGTIDCGGCTDGNVCDKMTKSCGPCVALTCESEGKNCGVISDGCGGTIDCTEVTGGCQGNQSCGAEGKPNVCGCKSRSCQDLGRQCGVSIDNCGRELDCDRQLGGCGGGGLQCQTDPSAAGPYQCFIPNCEGFRTCADAEATVKHALCGKYPNGCGGFVDCSQCSDGNICDRGTNTCSPYPVVTPGDPQSPPSPNVACAGPNLDCPDGFYCKTGVNAPTGICLDASCTTKTTNICVQAACDERVCGSVRDACSIDHFCGVNQGRSCPPNQSCRQNTCVTCTPLTLAECPPRRCGNISNGCGGTINCGTSKCEPGEACDNLSQRCVEPTIRTCAEQCAFEGKNCDTVTFFTAGGPQTCSCGTCTGFRESCGGGGYAGVCGITPPDAECLRQQSECGFVTDACGNDFLCGVCPGGGALPPSADKKCKANVTGGFSCQACLASDRKTCADYPGQCGAALPDGCGRFIDCSNQCGAGIVCDNTGLPSQHQGVCCAVNEVLAIADNPAIPGVPDPVNVVGDCCLPRAESVACPPGYCGQLQDSCGVVRDCGCGTSGGNPVACDNIGGPSGPFAPVVSLPSGYLPINGPIEGLCCQPGQVLSTDRTLPYGTAVPQASGDCCAQTDTATICQGAAPTNTSQAFCLDRADNCGKSITCPVCPLGRVCDDKGGTRVDPTVPATFTNTDRRGICCNAGEIVGLPLDAIAATQGGPSGPLVDNCCQPDPTFCNSGGPLNQRCGQWQDLCGTGVNCNPSGCTTGTCSLGDDPNTPNGPLSGTTAEPYSAPAITQTGFCCTTDPAYATPATICNVGGADRCGTWEGNCGGDYDCGGCANGAACDNNINDAGGLEAGGVCCATGQTALSIGQDNTARDAIAVVQFGDCCDPADTQAEREALCHTEPPNADTTDDRCGLWEDQCGLDFTCDTNLVNATSDGTLCSGSRACSTVTGLCCTAAQQLSLGNGPPTDAAGVPVAAGGCCTAMTAGERVTFCQGANAGSTADDRCGVFEDACGIDFDCGTVLTAPSGCLTTGACGAGQVCCPAGQEIAVADDPLRPNIGGAVIPAVGQCCTRGSTACGTHNLCQLWEDGCGGDINCGSATCTGDACDRDANNNGVVTDPNELGGVCCAPGLTALTDTTRGIDQPDAGAAPPAGPGECCNPAPANRIAFCTAGDVSGPYCNNSWEDGCGEDFTCTCQAANTGCVSNRCCAAGRPVNASTSACCTSLSNPGGNPANQVSNPDGTCCFKSNCAPGGGTQSDGCGGTQDCGCAPGTETAGTNNATIPGGNSANNGATCCAPAAPASCSTIVPGNATYCGPRENSCNNTAGNNCGCTSPRTCQGSGLAASCACPAGTAACGATNCCNTTGSNPDVCVSNSTCCSPTDVTTAPLKDAFCKTPAPKCRTQSLGCGLTTDCGTSYCPGDCDVNTNVCTCSEGSVCTQDCANDPSAGARSVPNPCGNPAAFNCPRCPGAPL